jgi:hypothetical protein
MTVTCTGCPAMPPREFTSLSHAARVFSWSTVGPGRHGPDSSAIAPNCSVEPVAAAAVVVFDPLAALVEGDDVDLLELLHPAATIVARATSVKRIGRFRFITDGLLPAISFDPALLSVAVVHHDRPSR